MKIIQFAGLPNYFVKFKKPVQDIVLIGRNTKTPYGNPHLGQQPPGKNITEVSRRHDESRIFTIPGTQTQPSEKIINGLSEDTGQVDRIDCGEADFFPKGQIREQFLDRGLGIVEGSLDSQRKYVAGARAGHLTFL